MIKTLLVSAIVALTVALGAPSALAGPLSVVHGEYRLPASIDPSVSQQVETELWAHVWRPTTGGPYPLVVFLHGNHATCGFFDDDLGVRIDDLIDYTFTGTCPSGYVVTPSHRGYDYVARPLASFGYVVVSINANRGVNAADGVPGDFGLNLRRGRLVLRHLQQLAEWNDSGNAPDSLGFELTGMIDFDQVGLMGHSRGGEGMRAAVAQYRDAGSPWPSLIGPVTFRSLFEIGPVDGQTRRTLNAAGLVWNVLLPACDGDVSDLQGIKPFDRMLRITNQGQTLPKSTFQVFGANHNFYNTEWQLSDSFDCLGQEPIFPELKGSAEQRATLAHTLIPFFRSNLGSAPNPNLALRFDPSHPLPNALTSITTYARGYSARTRAADNFVIDNFDQSTGTSSQGVDNEWSGLSAYGHRSGGELHDPSQRAAVVAWSDPGGFLQLNVAEPGAGVDVGAAQALEFRILLRCYPGLCGNPPAPGGDVDFSIALAEADEGLSSPVTLKSRAVVQRPAGSFSNNELFQTVRIPLSAFGGANLASFRGVRFIFDRDTRSRIFLANVRLTRASAGDTVLPAPAASSAGGASRQMQRADAAAADANRIIAIRSTIDDSARAWGESAAQVEIELGSSRRFPIGDSLPTLAVGGQEFTRSRFASGNTGRLVFTVDAAEFAELVDGDEVTVRVGGAAPWKFGRLDTSIAR